MNSEEVILENEEIFYNLEVVDISDHFVSNDTPDRYELPPKSIRGVPPKWYDPEYEAQRYTRF